MCSEVEVIHLWLTELLRSVENADDVLVKNFSFDPLEKRLKTGDYLRGETIRESLVRIPRLLLESAGQIARRPFMKFTQTLNSKESVNLRNKLYSD